MTIGIYCLQFEGTDKVYIGQSVNIERRFRAHLQALRHRNTSKKLLQAFDNHGVPIVEILVICTPDQLNELENSFIKEYNSVVYGFNSLEYAESIPNRHADNIAGSSLLKYTPEQVIEAFNILIESPTSTAKEISKLCGVSEGMVYAMMEGRNYVWLLNIDPINYTKYILNRQHGNSAAAKGIVYPRITSPSGEVILGY